MGLATTVFSAVFLATGGFLFGYDSGIITSTIALQTFKEYFNTPNDTTTGGIVSAFQGGAIAGTIFNMLFAHKMGRRWTILVGALVSVFGSAIQAGAVNMAMLIVGRFIGGVAVGQLTSTIPLYAAELSEAKHRGVLSGLLQWMLSWGFFVAQWLGYGCSFNSTQFSCEYICLLIFDHICETDNPQGASRLPSNASPVWSSFPASSSCRNHHVGSWRGTATKRPWPRFRSSAAATMLRSSISSIARFAMSLLPTGRLETSRYFQSLRSRPGARGCSLDAVSRLSARCPVSM